MRLAGTDIQQIGAQRLQPVGYRLFGALAQGYHDYHCTHADYDTEHGQQ
jgi:hypothetical protein